MRRLVTPYEQAVLRDLSFLFRRELEEREARLVEARFFGDCYHFYLSLPLGQMFVITVSKSEMEYWNMPFEDGLRTALFRDIPRVLCEIQ